MALKLAPVLVIVALVTPVLFAAAGAAPDDAWRAKLGPRLAETLDGDAEWARHADDAGRLPVIVVLPAPASPDAPPASRDAWRAHWASASAAHVDAVTALAAERNVPVRSVWPSVAAVAVDVAVNDVEAIARLDAAQSLHLDGPDMVRVHAEAASHGDGPGDDIPAMGVQDYWDAGLRGDGVRVAVIDTGLDADHTMLRDRHDCGDRVVAWKDFVNGRREPYDDNGHGTHVAGIAAGTSACGGRFDGMAPGVDLMGAKFLRHDGWGTLRGAMDALEWAFDNDADVAQNSWGYACSRSGAVERLVDALAEGGMHVVFSAGNSGSGDASMGCPAIADHAVSVGAVTRGKDVASFSSRGPCPDGRTCPDVATVGVRVGSSYPGNTYRTMSGTSMAAPHASGVAALIVDAARTYHGRDLAPAGGSGTGSDELENLLKLYAEDLGEAGADNDTGWGYVQAGRILDGFRSPDPFVIVDVDAPSHLLIGEGPEMATVRVWNFAGAPTEGALTVRVGGETVVAEASVTLDGNGRHTVDIPLDPEAIGQGPFHVNASYAFPWDGRDVRVDTSHAGRVHHLDVRMNATYPAFVFPGQPFEMVVEIANVEGTTPATDVRLDVTIPAAYVVVPRAPEDGRFNGLWSTPGPDTRRFAWNGSDALGYDVGAIAPGESWTLAYTLLSRDVGPFTQDADLAFTVGDSPLRVEEADAWPQAVGVLPPGVP